MAWEKKSGKKDGFSGIFRIFVASMKRLCFTLSVVYLAGLKSYGYSLSNLRCRLPEKQMAISHDAHMTRKFFELI